MEQRPHDAHTVGVVVVGEVPKKLVLAPGQKQLQDLIARVDLLLRSNGQPGLTLHPPEDEAYTPEPADPSDPGTFPTE